MASRFKFSLPKLPALRPPGRADAASPSEMTAAPAARLDDGPGGDLDAPLGAARAPRAMAAGHASRTPTKSAPPGLSKAIQFAAVAVVAFAVVGVALPRFLASRGGAAADDARALGPTAPWKLEPDAALAKRFADSEPELRPFALWRCDQAACGYTGRFMIFAGPQNELPRARLEALLDLAAAPYRGDSVWPAFPDTQAQGFRVGGKLYYVVSQSDRQAGAAATMVAGDVIDQIVARVAGADSDPKTTGGVFPKR
jgi:hypothetical protein